MSGGASRSKHLLLAWLTIHLLLAAIVCTHEIASLVGDGLTILPQRYNNCSLGAENFTGTVLGLNLSKSNPIRQGLATYLNLARTGEGYAYFAPNVPDAYRLVFN